MDNKKVQKANDKIKRTEALFDKMVTFLKSDKGAEMVKNFYSMSLPELITVYKAPNIRSVGRSPRQNGFMRTAIEKAGRMDLLHHNIFDYTMISSDGIKRAYKNWESDQKEERQKFVENYQKEKKPIRLLPYEQYVINRKFDYDIKKRPNGSLVIKEGVRINSDGEKEACLLFDKQSNKPIFKWKKKPPLTALAARLHAYEEHKMAKYDKRMAILEERDKRSDLFPEQIIAKYKMLREAHLEQVRKDLSDLYCSVPVHAIAVSKKTGEATKILNFANVRLGRTRSDKVDCDHVLRNDLTERLTNIMLNARQSNPDRYISCLHLTSHNPKKQRVILPQMLSIAA